MTYSEELLQMIQEMNTMYDMVTKIYREDIFSSGYNGSSTAYNECDETYSDSDIIDTTYREIEEEEDEVSKEE